MEIAIQPHHKSTQEARDEFLRKGGLLVGEMSKSDVWGFHVPIFPNDPPTRNSDDMGMPPNNPTIA